MLVNPNSETFIPHSLSNDRHAGRGGAVRRFGGQRLGSPS
jgi:hypothetical protein